MAEPVAIATWPWGKTAVEVASKLLAEGKSPLDAALAGAQAVEDDPTVGSVGFGGIANSIGTVTLDACVMDGATLDCGAVAGVENIRHVAALAKKVYEKTPHVMLVGKGAEWFAIQNGFPLETLLTPESVAEWYKKRPEKENTPLGHDTVTVLANNGHGKLGGACTTSGLSYKTPGRVGDSPLIGSGLYVDDEVGAAGATGVGEEIIRIAASSYMIEQMRGGKTPQEAVEAAAARVNKAAVRRGQHPARVAFIALSPAGEVGAACTQGANFKYAVSRGLKVEMHQAKEV